MQKDTTENKTSQHLYPILTTLDLVGGRWKLLIIWILQKKTYRFSELKRQIPRITQKMLIHQLRELETDGIVNRKVFAQVPPKVEYSLTEFGRSFSPVIRSINKWAESNIKSRKRKK